MAAADQRPSIRIRFRYNLDSGAMEFIVDDNAPARSDDYHDRVAEHIGAFLARNPEIRDAGTAVRYRLDDEWHELARGEDERDETPEQERDGLHE